MTVGSEVKGCYASVKNIEATLQILANKAQDVDSQQAFNEAQQIISEVKESLNQQVIHLTREEPQYNK
ncbi:DUF1657 domain-containing protein [Oceanobacillus caeni]|nr:DUF1657 domain-containing protein [Oceanobacillus caeni]KKE78998.1 hypothetical protein WH51_09710 [Bacilli bacterium VT-13-104]PZD83610.1 DUF1657 domain-containing protein [Bacilli bacterium]MBU8791606.1 DUF1657 domain-containing protein [Oceanobacillus caeni]MCR1836134.1 DUF1657 domain-containing protein [Oceanobacillus caeni]PZD85656.1 DUF1657 domain-containing protein [Bacilli bacterium]